MAEESPGFGSNYGSTLGGKPASMTEYFFLQEDSELEDRAPERNISWMSAAWVINASVLGMGVLTIPRCFATLGWLCGFVGLVVCLLANVLVAHLMLEVQEMHPRAISLADAAQIASGGSRMVKVVFRNLLYAEKIACTCAFMNLMADSLGSTFYAVHWCEVTWCGLIVIIFLPLMQLKNLHETFVVNIINFTTILAVVVLACGVLIASPRPSIAETTLLPAATSFQTAFGAISMMVFAYSGNWMYFELMAEMKQPRDFVKAFTIAGPTQLILYTVIGCIWYGLMGRSVPSSVLEALHFSPMMSLISFLLTIHIICGTGTNLIVLIRFFHSRISPRDLNDDTTRANFVRTVIFLCIICGTLLVSMTIRGIGAIVTLIGAVFEAPLNFVSPFVIYAGVMRGRPPRRTWFSRFVWVGGFLIAVFGLLTMVFGVMDAVDHVRHIRASSDKRLFACNCEGLWDTCACSASRMPPGVCRTEQSRPSWLDQRSKPKGLTNRDKSWLPLYPHD